MLDHDEERRLAEMEAHLRIEAPELHDLFDHASSEPEPIEIEATVSPRPSALTAIVRSLAALMMAIAVTAVVTIALGPDVGGFVAVVVFCIAGMYGYQTLRGCPGLRRARGER